MSAIPGNAMGDSVSTGEPVALFDPLLMKVFRRRVKNIVGEIKKKVKKKKDKT